MARMIWAIPEARKLSLRLRHQCGRISPQSSSPSLELNDTTVENSQTTPINSQRRRSLTTPAAYKPQECDGEITVPSGVTRSSNFSVAVSTGEGGGLHERGFNAGAMDRKSSAFDDGVRDPLVIRWPVGGLANFGHQSPHCPHRHPHHPDRSVQAQ